MSSRTMGVAVIMIMVVSIISVSVAPLATAQQSTPDDVSITINVNENGTAEWSVEYRVRLDDESKRNAFSEEQNEIQSSPETYISSFQNGINQTVQSAENSTGREMATHSYTVNAETRQIPQEYGVIEYQFIWENFATSDDGVLNIGDSLDGFFLNEKTSLTVTWNENYSVQDTSPESDSVEDGKITWVGPVDFSDGEPRIIANSTTTSSEDDSEGAFPLEIIGGVLLVLIFIGAGSYYMVSMDQSNEDDDSGNAGTSMTSSNGNGLRSNEERVMDALENNGGRIKQKEIASELDWSTSKASQVIREMRDEGSLKGFRLGRENVIVTPEEYERDNSLPSEEDDFPSS